MKFEMNGKRPRKPEATRPPKAQKASPAVPLSVYRELAAELQATQAMLDSLNAQNRQLRKSNRQMQLELDQIIESAQKMQQISAPAHKAKQQQVAQELQGQSKNQSKIQPKAQSRSSEKTRAPRAKSRPKQSQSEHPQFSKTHPPVAEQGIVQPNAVQSPAQTERELAVQALNKMLTDRNAGRSRPRLSHEKSGELSAWWLMIMVFFIVTTAFGTGFMLVRPFLSDAPINPSQPSDFQLVDP